MNNFGEFNVVDSGMFKVENQLPFVTNQEADLLLSAIAGETEAFENLVMPHRESIFRIVQRILRNREDAEDVVQAAFLHALRNLSSFQGRARFSSWLTRIAINTAFMHLRTSRHRTRETSIDEVTQGDERGQTVDLVEKRPNPEQACAEKEIRAVFNKAIDRLASDHIKVLHMRFVEELSVDEVAKTLEVATGTVKARLHRARLALSRQVRPKITLRPMVQ